MAEEAKKDASNPLLPRVEYPPLDMPPSPQIPGADPTAPHTSCENEVYVPPKENPNIPPPPEGKLRIMIAIPILSYTHEFVQSFLKFWTQLCLMPEDHHITVCYHFAYRKPVHMAEEELVDIAKYNKCTHILFMDDDIFDIKAEDLVKLVQADKEVIGGVMYANKFPHAMCVFRRYDTNRKIIDMPTDNSMYRLYEVPCVCPNPKCGIGLSHWDMKFCPVCGATVDNMIQKADLIPFAFTLMKLSIFDKIKRPWFHCTLGYPSDSWFADRCIEAGIQQYAHMGVRLNHNGCSDLTRPFLLQKGLAEAQALSKGMVYISPEEMNKHEFMLMNKMKEAETKVRAVPVMPETITVPPVPKEDSNDSKESNIEENVPVEQSTEIPG